MRAIEAFRMLDCGHTIGGGSVGMGHTHRLQCETWNMYLFLSSVLNLHCQMHLLPFT